MRRDEQHLLAHGPDLAWVSRPDRVVIIRLSDLAAEPLVLRDSAVVIWAAVDEGAPVSKVVDTVLATYEHDPATVRSQTLSFIDACLESGVLTLTSSPD